ncbi:MAG: hypothetical protein IIA87_04535 [Nanoarchaeota archaeon]|nr:hypothetical protein [Nanoarchaeota archaeon]
MVIYHIGQADSSCLYRSLEDESFKSRLALSEHAFVTQVVVSPEDDPINYHFSPNIDLFCNLLSYLITERPRARFLDFPKDHAFHKDGEISGADYIGLDNLEFIKGLLGARLEILTRDEIEEIVERDIIPKAVAFFDSERFSGEQPRRIILARDFRGIRSTVRDAIGNRFIVSELPGEDPALRDPNRSHYTIDIPGLFRSKRSW